MYIFWQLDVRDQGIGLPRGLIAVIRATEAVAGLELDPVPDRLGLVHLTLGAALELAQERDHPPLILTDHVDRTVTERIILMSAFT